MKQQQHKSIIVGALLASLLAMSGFAQAQGVGVGVGVNADVNTSGAVKTAPAQGKCRRRGRNRRNGRYVRQRQCQRRHRRRSGRPGQHARWRGRRCNGCRGQRDQHGRRCHRGCERCHGRRGRRNQRGRRCDQHGWRHAEQRDRCGGLGRRRGEAIGRRRGREGQRQGQGLGRRRRHEVRHFGRSGPQVAATEARSARALRAFLMDVVRPVASSLKRLVDFHIEHHQLALVEEPPAPAQDAERGSLFRAPHLDDVGHKPQGIARAAPDEASAHARAPAMQTTPSPRARHRPRGASRWSRCASRLR